MKIFTLLLIVIAGLASTTLQASQAIEQLQERYRKNGVTTFVALDGKEPMLFDLLNDSFETTDLLVSGDNASALEIAKGLQAAKPGE